MSMWTFIVFDLMILSGVSFMIGQLSGLQYHRHIDRSENRCYCPEHTYLGRPSDVV